MLNRRSIYALNKKDSEAVVYTEKNRRLVRVTEKDIPPDCSFPHIKEWSDADYHAAENQDHLEANHTISLELIPAGGLKACDPEALLIHREEREAEIREALKKVAQIRALLTKKQFNRLWLYCVDGLSEAEIANIEGTSQQAISRALQRAKDKIKKFFTKL